MQHGGMLATRRGQVLDPWRSERSCVLARRGMVCSSVPIASAAGVAMLRQRGNAIDAAIAAAAALCVVEPIMTGVGGDAFALVASAGEGHVVGNNGSGRAPAAATADAYRARGLDAIAPGGILSATVPGAVHAWQSLSQRFGALPLATVLEPAIRAAADGFPVTELVAHTWDLAQRVGFLRNDAARASWLAGGSAPRAGEWFRAPGLARTLRQIAEGGAAAFYEGEAAKAIVAASREEDGFFEMGDLARHSSTWVEPIATTYRGVEVLEMPPNGQGIAALQALGILECFEPAASTSVLDWHRRIEAVKIAFADRAAYIADPEHADVPIAALLDKEYARRRAALVGDRALAGVAAGLEGDTTYLCAADEHGNLV
jgi:gamma-glutamyltranspeptidase/glutathione hydrolase